MSLTPRRVCWGTERGFRRLSFPDRPAWILSWRDGGRAAIRPDWGPSATRALQQTRTGPSRAPSLALIETKPVASLPGRGGDCRRLGSSALGDVRSPLKKPPGEGTGPTIDADLRGNLVGRVPPRGEPDVFQQAVRGGFIAPTSRQDWREQIDNLHLYLHMDPCDIGYDIVTLLRRYGLEGKADVSVPNFSLSQPLTDEQLNRLYNLFDVTVLPSTGEGFGLPIIESFAAGVPVVATDCSACSELVRGRGELVRILTTVTVGANLIEHAVIDVEHLAACIEKLYRNSGLGRQYAEAGLAFARSLSWESLVPKWLELISSATGSDVADGFVTGPGQRDDAAPNC